MKKTERYYVIGYIGTDRRKVGEKLARELGCGVLFLDDEIERLNNAPHYMVCDKNTKEQRHGLGLLIVKQIAAAHGGKINIGHSASGGFMVEFILPLHAQ